jgi:two-component system, NarL family, nitrate/nitrite response regulator NarL
MKKTIQVMVVEDHPEYREAVGLALREENDIELSSEFGAAERALRSLQDLSMRRKPDIVLLDLNLPGMSGLDALPWFKKYAPESKIIVLTQSNAKSDVLQAIRLGASGYLLKSSTVAQIVEGIRTVMSGGATLEAGVAQLILETLKQRLPSGEIEKVLTGRELEILTLLGEGLAKKEIADRLGIATSTVVTHVSHIYEKLDVSNAPSAIDKAHRLGLFSGND